MEGRIARGWEMLDDSETPRGVDLAYPGTFTGGLVF